jgi:acetylornithine deacetylase
MPRPTVSDAWRDSPVESAPGAEVKSVDGVATNAMRTFVSEHTPRWVSLLRDLIRLPSLLGSEHALVARVIREIESTGVPAQRVPHDRRVLTALAAAQAPFLDVEGRASLAVRLRGSGNGRSLALNAHMDIVPAGDESTWTHPPHEGFIDPATNTIFGRGAMDDKAGVVAVLAVMQTLAALRVPLAGDVLFHFVLEDESTGNGTLLCLQSGSHADAAIIVDGTRLDRAIREHAGTQQFTVSVTGRPASVSVSHLGINAAEVLAQLVLDLREAVFALNAGRADPWTRFPSPYQMVIHALDSTGEPNTVPAAASGRCYVTFPPPYDLGRMTQFVRDRVAAFAARQGLPISPAIQFDGYAADPVRSPRSDLDRALQAAVVASGLPPVDIGPSTGTSDMRHYVAEGTECLLYGPGAGFNPHRADEHFRLEDLPRIVLVLLNLVLVWCAEPVETQALRS